MTTTIMEMMNQSNFIQLAIMAGIMIGWILMIRTLAKGVEAKFAADKKEPAIISSPVKSADGAVTAVISAAVAEYRKTNK